MHAVAVHPGHRLGQETGRQPEPAGHLTADQLVELNLIGGDHGLGKTEIHLELRGRDLRMILFVQKAHGPLCLRGPIDELTQRVLRQ